jgi:hypothetical protein
MLARTEEEILAAKADAMRRIGETLEKQLAELERLRAAAAVAEGEERMRLRDRHRALLDRARLQRWYLLVQREAVGLRHHHGLHRHYPLPQPLTDESSRSPRGDRRPRA